MKKKYRRYLYDNYSDKGLKTTILWNMATVPLNQELQQEFL